MIFLGEWKIKKFPLNLKFLMAWYTFFSNILNKN